MKKLILFLLPFFIFISCNSTKVESYNYDDEDSYNYEESEEKLIQTPETSEDYLGDFDAIKMSELMFLTKTRKTVKPRQVSKVYLVPRSNTVELTFRDSVNEVTLSLNKSEREKMINVCNTFLEQYESKTVPHQKVNSKTAYLKSKMKVWYGVLSATVQCSSNDYFMNCEFINKKPYLLIQLIPSRCDDKEEFTPKTALYMSPSQVRDFIEAMDQEYLNSYLEDLIEKAYTY